MSAILRGCIRITAEKDNHAKLSLAWEETGEINQAQDILGKLVHAAITAAAHLAGREGNTEITEIDVASEVSKAYRDLALKGFDDL